ncbi:MAG: hypothetical protein KZQ66_01460, partial [Candidatus Thiodiazotropha sp. (ex Lucinoma aequizonata)]|nr:hypothetical protein [Candidatus Thiodiazotropha sp. (ex Lucinoma aequizonata)]MCU7908919.1 hypothetical protein [Candidatus Thiodiazotropha sp. (ex Lucinoma aequizonata)]
MIGRGYPDSIVSGDLPTLVDDVNGEVTGNPGELLNNGTPTQTLDSVISVAQDERLLLSARQKTHFFREPVLPRLVISGLIINTGA